MPIDLVKNQIYRICTYHPYRLSNGERNPKVDQDSKYIMDLKDRSNYKYQKAVCRFADEISVGINKRFVDIPVIQIAVVPSSRSENPKYGLMDIIDKLDTTPTIKFKPTYLERHTSVKSAHDGGPRDAAVHMGSIHVKELPDKNIPLLLIDDVTTTGNSMEACKNILTGVGVQNIFMLALGQTAEHE